MLFSTFNFTYAQSTDLRKFYIKCVRLERNPQIRRFKIEVNCKRDETVKDKISWNREIRIFHPDRGKGEKVLARIVEQKVLKTLPKSGNTHRNFSECGKLIHATKKGPLAGCFSGQTITKPKKTTDTQSKNM